ncbi:MAG: PhoPQ-activated protein PqaA family protein, partial [Pirellulales bacterium]
MRVAVLALLICSLFLVSSALADDPAQPVAARAAEFENNALFRYVEQPDDSYGWTKRREGKIGKGTYVELTLTSQTWRGITWKHQLFIVKPSTMKADARHALLVIEGGRWSDGLDQPAGVDDRLPREAPMFAELAEQLQTPMAVLLQVPHQPIFDGKVEDQIIAYTFEQFLQTKDDTWPLLLPMTKSAVRAMDAVTEFAADECSLDIKEFTVTGASKRGWTTWLVGAVD